MQVRDSASETLGEALRIAGEKALIPLLGIVC